MIDSSDEPNQLPARLPAGMRLKDNTHEYSVTSEIGSGGYGCAYLLTFEVDGVQMSRVAKVPLVADEESSRRFAREARVLTSVTHQHVVKVHGTAALVDGRVALIEDYVSGATTLPKFIQRRPEHASSLLLQALYALRALHENQPQIVHRDLAPNNILVNEQGHLTVIDFGLAKESPSNSGTLTTGVVGTRGVIAPEQYKDASMIDGRADLYGLGRTFAGALIGCEPMHAVAPDVKDPTMREILMRLTMLTPEARPESADAAIAFVLEKYREDRVPMELSALHLVEWEHVSENHSSSKRAWESYLVAALNAVATLTPNLLEFISSLSYKVWTADQLDVAALFDRFIAVPTSPSTEVQLITVLEQLFPRLDGTRRIHAFGRVIELAASGSHKARAVEALHFFYSSENSARTSTKYDEILERADIRLKA